MRTDGAQGRWFLVLLVVATLLQAATAVARPMASYRALDIGMPVSSLGLVAAAFAIAPMIFALSIGRWIDRIGEFPFIVAGGIAMALASIAMTLIEAPFALLGSIAVLGLGQLVFVVANQTLVGSRSPTKAYDRRFGHLSFVASFGQLIGPAAAGLIAGSGNREGTSMALLFGTGLSLATIPLVVHLWRADPGPVVARPVGPQERASVLAILRMPGMGPAMLASMTVLATMDVIVVYLPALGEERGLTVATVGALLAVRAGGSMASRLLLGRLIDWFGRDRLMLGSLMISAVSVAALAILPLEAMFVVMALAGVTLGVCQPMTMSWVAARATEGSRGTAMSLRLLGNRVGQVIIPIAAGSVAVVTGTAGVLAAAGVSVALSAAVVAVRGRWSG